MRISDWSSDVCSSDLVSPPGPPGERGLMADGAHIARFLLPLLEGARITLVVSAGAFVVAVAAGLALATLRYFLQSRLVRIPITIYVEMFRNVPSLTHLFLIYFGLAYVGLRLDSITAAILGQIGRASGRERVCQYVSI